MLTRRVLLAFADRPAVQRLLQRSAAGRRLARRFVAGETVDDALEAARAMSRLGFRSTLDCLGENVTRDEEADAARDVYLGLLDRLRSERLESTNVSVKLTQMGLDLSFERCRDRVAALAERAAAYNNFVRVDMEGSAYTQRTLDMVRALRRRFGNIGAVIQSYLRRSEADVEQLLSEQVRIRLCKGAYHEPPEAAYQRKSEVDENFVRLMRRLLSSGVFHGIATHDLRMVRATQEHARAANIPAGAFEFQMLYGVRRDMQARLLRDGYGVRLYIPFGAQWFPYLMRRLAERPANLLFFLRNLLRG